MDIAYLGCLFFLGMLGGTLSGLLGIGGGIIMFPLLLYFPSFIGFAALSVKAAAAITSVQSFFGALSGAFAHHRYKRVNLTLAWYFGGSMCVTSLIGSLLSKVIADDIIILVFACMAIVAAYMMLRPKPSVENDTELEANDVMFNKPLALVCGAVLGMLSGLIGQGGGFIFVPVMLYILHIPTRITIGTALIVGVASSSAVLLGRIGTLQIPILLSIVTVAGAIVGAQLGARLSQMIPRHRLRQILSAVITLTAARMLYGVIA